MTVFIPVAYELPDEAVNTHGQEPCRDAGAGDLKVPSEMENATVWQFISTLGHSQLNKQGKGKVKEGGEQRIGTFAD